MESTNITFLTVTHKFHRAPEQQLCCSERSAVCLGDCEHKSLLLLFDFLTSATPMCCQKQMCLYMLSTSGNQSM